MTDKMREDFEAAYSLIAGIFPAILKYAFEDEHCLTTAGRNYHVAYAVYQAATAESTAKIAQMQVRIDELEDRHKRDGDEYHAMHCALMDTLAKVKDVK